MSDTKADLQKPVGYNAGEQHIGKSKTDSSESDLPPQTGTRGQPESHVSGQGGPEIMGGSASQRVVGQSVDEQLKSSLPGTSEKK